MIKFDLTVTLGNLLLLAGIAGIAYALSRRVWEHDMMWKMFCRIHGINRSTVQSLLDTGDNGDVE